MAESNSFPGDLAECHRLMAEQQALFADMERRGAQQYAEQQQQYAEEKQRRSDVEQVLNRTAMISISFAKSIRRRSTNCVCFAAGCMVRGASGTLRIQSSSICLR